MSISGKYRGIEKKCQGIRSKREKIKKSVFIWISLRAMFFPQKSGCKRRRKWKGTRDKNSSSPLPPDQCSQISRQNSLANALHQFPTFQPRDLLTSETLFAPGLDWKATLSDKSGQDQTSCGVNGRLRIGCTRLSAYDWSA